MNSKYVDLFHKHELYFGRMLSGSKSGYRDANPHHLIVFNAKIYLKTYYEFAKGNEVRDFFEGQQEEIWYGDLDLNKDIYTLWRIQRQIQEPIVITDEMGSKIVEIGDKEYWIGYTAVDGKKKGITNKDIDD